MSSGSPPCTRMFELVNGAVCTGLDSGIIRGFLWKNGGNPQSPNPIEKKHLASLPFLESLGAVWRDVFHSLPYLKYENLTSAFSVPRSSAVG